MWRLPLLGLTGLIGLTLFALPATGTLTAENVADRSGTDQAYLKRDDLADDLVLVADDDDDDTNSKNTRTKNTKTRQSKTPNTPSSPSTAATPRSPTTTPAATSLQLREIVTVAVATRPATGPATEGN